MKSSTQRKILYIERHDELESNGNEKKYDDEENLSLKYFESKKK